MAERGGVVLVTGASSGIGRATAARLAREGFRVYGTSRHPERAPAGDGVEMLRLDVTDDASVRGCVESVLADAGRIDVLVNNAGVALGGESEGTTLAQAQAEFDTNFFGTVRVVNAVLPAMRRQGGGRIVNVASMAGVGSLPFAPFYTASKHAVEGYSEALRFEVAPFGIGVTVIEPGWIRTAIADRTAIGAAPVAAYDQMRDAAFAWTRRMVAGGSAPERVAGAILRAVRARRPPRHVRVGRTAHTLTAMRRLLPAPVLERAMRRMVGLPPAAPPGTPSGA